MTVPHVSAHAAAAATSAANKAIKLTTFDIIGMVVSGLCFLFMSYQLLRSACHYRRKFRGEFKSIVAIHTILIFANFAYLLYEFNQTNKNPIPLMFTMMFLLNLASVWTFFLIDGNSATGESHMSAMGQKSFKFLIGLLIGLFVTGFFFGTYGVQCTKDRPAKGQGAMAFFQVCWTIHVIKHFKKQKGANGETMLHARSSSVKELLKTSKDLALDSKDHEFDMAAMQDTQKKMYLVL
jgi:hypothetical protein